MPAKPLPLVLLLITLFGASCRDKNPPGNTDGGASAQSAPPPVAISAAASSAPATDGGLGKRPTSTSWSIAGPNLDAEITDRLKRAEPRPEQRLYLVELLIQRGQYIANVADYETADTLSASHLADNPKDAFSLLERAFAYGAFHKFDDELKTLDQITTKDRAVLSRISGARAGVFMALGRYDEAEKLMPSAESATSPIALTTAAVLAGHTQKIDESEALFARARSSFVDVTPFPIAWMDFQHGLLLEARGKESQARLHYAEALEAIPDYVHAAVHLAATDKPEDAITRLEALRKKSTDPDILVALADAYKKTKKDVEAKELTEKAKTTYESLVAKHPEAYRDHAARFYLGAGNDSKKALELAEKNAALRPTEEAIDLWMATAAGAERKDAVCKSAAAMNKLRWASESRKRLAAAALNACPDTAKK